MQQSNRPLADDVFQGSVIMEEAPLVSAITKSSEPGSLIMSTEPPESRPELRETMLAVITCVCLVAMISVVVALIVSSSDLVKAIICTVGETATDKYMYPMAYCDYIFYTEVYARGGRIDARRNKRSWQLFHIMAARGNNTEFGISFAVDLVTPENLEESAVFLDSLRSDGIRHYGLLTVHAFADEYNSTVSNTRAIIKKLKKLQATDGNAKTVLAFGPYDYSEDFMPTIKAVFTNTANTFLADIVIAITSTGWLGFDGYCNAVPPNYIRTDNLGHFVLESHWFAVSARTTFSKPSIITGLSFELSALRYVMVDTPTSLNGSVFQPCLSVKKSGREALCKHTDFIGYHTNYLAYPIFTYGVFFNASKVLTLSEYRDSLAAKFLTAVRDFGGLRENTAWLLYNVHNQGPSSQCPEPPFTVIKQFSAALKGVKEPTYH
ncbi:hypothetical protein MTO96_036830 [Rhipicephalus appendiculatus]